MRSRKLAVAAAVVVPWLAAACSHENDARDEAARLAATCPDVTTSEAFAVGRAPDVDLGAAIDDMMCDGEISEEEDRCLRSPWGRNPVIAADDEFADSVEGAVLAVAGRDTSITDVVERRRKARVSVELDGAEGVYDVVRLPRGWVVVGGEGCASGAAVEPLDEDDMSEECQQAMEEATPDADGDVFFICDEEVTDGPVIDDLS